MTELIEPTDPLIIPASPEEPGLALRISRGGVRGLAALTLLIVVLVFLAGQLLQLINLPFGLAMTSLFIFGAAGLVCPAAFNLRPAAFTGISRPAGAILILAIILGLVNLPLANYLMGVCHEILPRSWSANDDMMTEIFADADRPARIVLVLAAGVAAPIGEELFFRGWLQRLIAQRFSTGTSILVAAILFSLVHFDAVGFPARVELGIIFGLARVWSGSLWPSIALHATHNLVSMGSFFFGDQSDADEPFQWGLASAIGLGSLVAVWLCLSLFRWLSRDRHEASQRDVPETDRVPLRFTPQRAARLLGPISLAFAVCLGLLLAFHSSLPGAALTKDVLPAQLGGGSSTAPANAPHPEDGGSHAK